MRDFRVPLGRVSVQECITNAHCADHQLAYCIKDHCGGFLVSAAAAGVNAFACMRNQECTLENVAARGVSEALKVIPIAAHLKCGPEAALDPNFLPESAMPCVADVDADGKCDVHLGVNHFFGYKTRPSPTAPSAPIAAAASAAIAAIAASAASAALAAIAAAAVAATAVAARCRVSPYQSSLCI